MHFWLNNRAKIIVLNICDTNLIVWRELKLVNAQNLLMRFKYRFAWWAEIETFLISEPFFALPNWLNKLKVEKIDVAIGLQQADCRWKQANCRLNRACCKPIADKNKPIAGSIEPIASQLQTKTSRLKARSSLLQADCRRKQAGCRRLQAGFRLKQAQCWCHQGQARQDSVYR